MSHALTAPDDDRVRDSNRFLEFASDVGEALELSPDDVILCQEQMDATRARIMVLRANQPVTQTHEYRQVLSPHGLSVEAEISSLANVEQFASKTWKNIASLPGGRLLLGRPAKSRLPNGDYPLAAERLALKRSAGPVLMLADVVARLIPLAERIGLKKSNIKLSYMTDEEIDLVEKLQSWRLIQGKHQLGRFLPTLEASWLGLQFCLLFINLSHKSLEDVEGMSANQPATSVLLSAQSAFVRMAQASAACQGAVRTTETSLLLWVDAAAKAEYPEFIRGFFPDRRDAVSHVSWLQQVETRRMANLRKHWLLRIWLTEAQRWLQTNSTTAHGRALPDSSYVARPRPARKEDLDRLLAEYSTSTDELVRQAGVGQHATVKLTGSIAMGWGNARSDIDVVVLEQSLPALNGITASISEGHRELKVGTTRTGQSVWVEHLSETLMVRLQDWIANIEPFLSPGPDDRLGARARAIKVSLMAWLYHRAFNSVLIQKGDYFARCEELRSRTYSTFASAMTISHLTEFRILKERARTGLVGGELFEAVCWRRAHEELLLAYLASSGIFLRHKRWITVALAQLGDQSLVEPASIALLPSIPDGVSSGVEIGDLEDHLLREIVNRCPPAERWLQSIPTETLSLDTRLLH